VTETPEARYVGIGIGTYLHQEYPALPGAPLEVREIADLLSARGVGVTVAATTTETGLMDELDAVLAPGSEGSAGPLVVLWAGHGDRLPDASLRLVAEDTAKGRAARLTAEYVASVAVRSGATQVLLIFDTCFSGGGALPVLAGADRWFAEQPGPPGQVWLGVLASAMDWQRARDDLFGVRLARLLRDGPSREDIKLRWSAHNAGIRGDDLIDAVQKEWAEESPHRPKAAQFGNPWVLLPNPRHDPAAPPKVVEHLLLAARGGEPEDETWYFTGRQAVVGRLVSWMGARQPGICVVTGPAGCGKSAVLGLVVCLSHPEQRAGLLARGPLEYADPGVGSVHAHVYARGLARGQLVRELDGQLSDSGVLPSGRRGQRGGGELADAVAAGGACPVIVIDGLDEAGVEAWPIAEEVLRPLARHALILVGTRDLAPPDGGDSLVTRLQPDVTRVVHLLEEVDDAADVRGYVLRRLQAGAAPGMDAGQVAGAILALPAGDQEGRFLLARVITAQLRAAPVDTTRPGWQQGLATSVEEALDRDLAGLPARLRGEDRLDSAGPDLLAALAWAQGGGLPDDIWPLIATAISADNTVYTRDDAFWALTAAGRYIVEAGEAGHAVYRLSHQRLAQHLRTRTRDRGVADAELSIAAALIGTYQALLRAGVPAAGHVYLWRYMWRHCADAGTAGIAVLRRLAHLDRAEFLPDLALASRYLADRLVEAGKPLEAVGPAEDAVTAYRELAAANPAYLPDLAGAVGNLGVRYGAVGRRADAVPPAEQAVALYRDQAAANPAYLPDLAAALGNLGTFYSDVGRRADAIPPAGEAVALYRDQAAANPAYLPDLAGALGNLGIRYGAVGRRADAVPPAEEAVALYRDQAAANPAYLPDLARTLDSLGVRYGAVGRRADAVPPAEEAVALYRDQAAANPTCLPDLAGALGNLGNRYSEMGRRADAVPPAEEAVALYRDQAAANPAYLPDLAMVVGNLGVRYREVGRRADAVPPAEEAVALYRDQAAANPAYLPDLARVLINLGVYYSEVGRHADAVPPAEEAMALYRDQAAANPAYLPDLAGALGNLGNRYGAVGRRADAVPPAEEAVALYREQAAANPAYLPDLAAVLGNLGKRYSEVGRPADAVPPAEEAVALYREQAAANPAYLPDLAMALGNLGTSYSQVGRADAVPPAEEAVALYRDQAAANPAYLPDLAVVLGNLGMYYSQVGRRADAVPATEEAMALYRNQAASNPAYLPDLAGALGNLGIRYSEVDRHADAVSPAEEAVALYRDQAAANPADLPDLAAVLGNLGTFYSDVGRRADAVPPTEEALALYRNQAAANPAYLPSLATALDHLGQYRLDAGLSWNADAVAVAL
jgi:tetratricopeptide (TPR) repeat protein